MNYKCFIFVLAAVLLLSFPSEAFEDNFQYYPGGVFSSAWTVTDLSSGGGCDPAVSGGAAIIANGATYGRTLRLNANAANAAGCTASVRVVSRTGTSSNYWSFVIRDTTSSGGGPGASYGIRFYNISGGSIWSYTTGATGNKGLWELTVSGGSVFARINGVDQGALGATIVGTPYYIAFETTVSGNGAGTYQVLTYIDDVTTSGYISGIGTESTSHTLTESNLQPTNISYTINTFPFADYTSDYVTNLIQKYTGSTPATIISTEIKPSGSTAKYSGFTNYTRDTQITSSDTDYGLYFSHTQVNNVTVVSDYFFLVPPGSTDSVTAEDTSAVIGQEETITYSIGTPDFAGNSYTVNVYSLTALVDSFQIATGEASGTLTWDTTGNSPGLYFITLSKTTSGIQTDIAYTTITLVSTLLIRGTVYNAVNASTMSGVNINFSQGTTFFNTTSDSSGLYNLSGLTVSIPLNVNASKTGFNHSNFTFTPLAPQIYTLNLYLLNATFNCFEYAEAAGGGGTSTNTCINGIVESNPYHQAVGGATVNLGNSTYFNTTTSNATTGYYQFLNLTDEADKYYDVNASKTGFRNSSEYNVSTINGQHTEQIILIDEIYTLTIQAEDATNAETILDFTALFNLVSYNTTIGQITITNLTYNSYPAVVSSTGYLSSSQSILVDSSKTVTFHLTPVTIPPSSTVFKTLPHDVSFTVQDLAFNKYSGVYVTAQGYNTTVGSFDWLSNLIGIDFGEIPINNQTMNGTTGTDGSIDFKMDGSIYYIITFNSSEFSNITWSGYPTQYNYLIIVPTTHLGTFTNNTEEFAVITTRVSTAQNSSAMDIYANYSDSLSETTDVKIYINQSILNDPNNQTNLQIFSGGAVPNFNATYTATSYAGQSYIVTFVFTQTSLGTVTRSYGVTFPPASPVSYFNPISILMLIVGLIIFFASFWGQTSTEQGAAVIVGLVWLLSGMGLYQNINLGVNFYLGLTLATIIAIIMNINARQRKEGIQ